MLGRRRGGERIFRIKIQKIGVVNVGREVREGYCGREREGIIRLVAIQHAEMEGVVEEAK
jgi:hypothetical protein